jgi:hypothetical protein
METVRDSWTDERLDNLNAGVVELRREMRQEFGAVRQEMREEFGAVRKEMREEFGSLHARFDGMQQTMIRFGGIVIAALIGLVATQIAALIGLVATQI